MGIKGGWKWRKLPRPKVTFGRFGQVFFVFREVTKIAFRINKKWVVMAFLFSAILGFSSIPGFYLQKLILDELIGGIGSKDWRPVLTVVGGLLLARFGLELMRNLIETWTRFLRRSLSRYFDVELERMMGRKLAELDMATLENSDFKDKYDKIRREANMRAWGLMQPVTDIAGRLVGFFSAVGVLVFFNPLVAAGVVLVGIPRLMVNSRFIKREYELAGELSPKYRIAGWLGYYLVRNRNYSELKLLDLSGYLSRRYEKIASGLLKLKTDLLRRREVFRIGGELPLLLYELAISVVLAVWVIIERITIGTFQLYLSSLRSAQENLQGLAYSILEIYENYIYVADLVWFLGLKPEIEGKVGGKKFEEGAELGFEFREVWFRYKKEQPWIIKGVNLRVRPRENVALVGLNGAGKSTLIKLLARLYDPQKGEILVNGVKISELDLKWWRKKLSILFQEFETYPFSVYESVGYGDVERVKEKGEIRLAVKKTGMEKYAEGLPLRYKNPLAAEFKKGVSPSIGQWQRLGIARMLFRRRAKILIMDEPTSNVDPEAEEKIFGELVNYAREKSLVFVTQRFSTVQHADRILVLGEGEITEEGTHKELMELEGQYARLFKLQAKGYQEK